MGNSTILPDFSVTDVASILSAISSVATAVSAIQTTQTMDNGKEFWYGDNLAGAASNASLAAWSIQSAAADTFGTPLQIDDGTGIAGGLATNCYRLKSILITIVSSPA
jgi:hypothetical protein